jgi:hypothetical protein
MLTIKHVKIGGDEVLEQVDRAEFRPKEAGASYEGGRVLAERLNESLTFTGGTIFVMNDFGKTVARYDLGASPVPL